MYSSSLIILIKNGPIAEKTGKKKKTGELMHEFMQRQLLGQLMDPVTNTQSCFDRDGLESVLMFLRGPSVPDKAALIKK